MYLCLCVHLCNRREPEHNGGGKSEDDRQAQKGNMRKGGIPMSCSDLRSACCCDVKVSSCFDTFMAGD